MPTILFKVPGFEPSFLYQIWRTLSSTFHGFSLLPFWNIWKEMGDKHDSIELKIFFGCCYYVGPD